MYLGFERQFAAIPDALLVIVELSALGGDPEVARMMGEDIRYASDMSPKRRFVFLGKPPFTRRMTSADIAGKPAFVRELMPEDLKLDIEQFTRREAVAAARYLASIVGKARGRQMCADDRKIWELTGRHPPDLSAPTWLRNAVAALLVHHEEAYLAHCRSHLAIAP